VTAVSANTYEHINTDIVAFSCEEAEARADQAAKLMTTVKAGVEHLAEKLQHLKAVCSD